MAKFEVDGVNYELVQSPTFGEARAIEKVTGTPFGAIDMSRLSIDTVQALVWNSMHRVNPDITFDDVDDIDTAILAGLFEALEEENEEADPTEAAAVVEEPPTSDPSA